MYGGQQRVLGLPSRHPIPVPAGPPHHLLRQGRNECLRRTLLLHHLYLIGLAIISSILGVGETDLPLPSHHPKSLQYRHRLAGAFAPKAAEEDR